MIRAFLVSSVDTLAAILTHPFGAVLLVVALISLAPVVASTAGLELPRRPNVRMCDPATDPAARVAP